MEMIYAWEPMTPALGFVPRFFHVGDDRPASEQLEERYAHGGGFRPMEGFELDLNREAPLASRIIYPADEDGPEEVYRAVSYTLIGNELLIMFESSWLGIVQPDGEFAITRVD